MSNAYEQVIKSATRQFLLRALIWFVGVLVVYGVSEWIHTAYWPTVSTSVAVNQLESSDAAFIEMQTVRQVKNSFTTITALICVVWSVLVWLDYVVRSGFKVKLFVEKKEDA